MNSSLTTMIISHLLFWNSQGTRIDFLPFRVFGPKPVDTSNNINGGKQIHTAHEQDPEK